MKMKAIFLPPRGNYLGNLVWNTEAFEGSKNEIAASLGQLREIGYWASPFPEGDGVTFKIEDKKLVKSNEKMLEDFKKCFGWIEIELAESGDSNTRLAMLESDRELKCIVIVPLEKIFIEETISIGPYIFFCRRGFDPDPYERYADFESEYLQFETSILYKDLLRLNQTLDHNDYVINKCLSLAEHALDLVRYVCSSFTRREFTPNPAGQMDDGFYAVDIIPIEKTHIKPISLKGISRPLSVHNNWLGPQVDDFHAEGIDYLSAIYNRDIDNQMSASIVSALRSCRQSFYSLGSESQFLNLVFTLDGLTEPEGKGWKQRTYISALLSKGCLNRFEDVLLRYDELYFEVRNKLVHEGMDFYQLSENPDQACEDVYGYIKDIIELAARELFSDIEDMKAYAVQLLRKQDFKDKYTNIINTVSLSRGKTPQVLSW